MNTEKNSVDYATSGLTAAEVKSFSFMDFSATLPAGEEAAKELSIVNTITNATRTANQS